MSNLDEDGASPSVPGEMSSEIRTSETTQDISPPPSYTETTNFTITSEQNSETRISNGYEQPLESNVVSTANENIQEGALTTTLRTDSDNVRPSRGLWPYDSCVIFACFSCVVGIYNISRFAVLVHVYKACFFVEFIILSCVFGFPFLYLQMALGQYIGSGLTDMWYITPAFKGVGLAMLYLYVLLGVYTSVPISWLFLYFKDSFITTRDTYKWGQCNPKFGLRSCLESRNLSTDAYLGWSVPNYFHGRILGRRPGAHHHREEFNFEITFNLAVIWLLVFIILSRGIRLYGKLTYVIVVVPLSSLLIMSVRMMEVWGNALTELFDVQWKTVLIDSSSWFLAAREVFLTWVLYGGVVLQLCSHNKATSNITRNMAIVGIGGTLTLILSSFFSVCIMKSISARNMTYVPSSYEIEQTIKCLQPSSCSSISGMNSTPINLVIGEKFPSSSGLSVTSGYQVLRLATEIFPSALAVQGVNVISSFWPICFYFMMIIFGLAQITVIWITVVESIIAIKPNILLGWQTVITLTSCTAGFLLGLPMTSTIGIFVLYFMDFCVGSLWWISILYMVMLIAILFIRGRPYGTDQLVTVIARSQSNQIWLLPILTFQWNVVLPVLSISFLQSGNSSSMWADYAEEYPFWAPWVKKLSMLIQVLPLISVVGVAIFQGFLYLKPSSTQAFHERIQSLCFPAFASANITSGVIGDGANRTSTIGVINTAYEEDPPPKYTPPPSYSSATARMMVHFLNRRHSVMDLATGQSTSLADSPNIASVELVSYEPQPENSVSVVPKCN
ncbi:sodium- and chloride-dependent glycine transporter 1-like isoform X2 [Limulus polyphemus]|uniref:Sodium- and chloride-dependent glycine transporter 1-like isoform X2 n=1 Tax=Limulus polyphemus TaxID=6850 RepID=A0ABM1S331_LIMPO|nr:sodium- and chloride-dependent glycine transporter 1-like isoform X2 [Limulus polyphemus]